MADGVTRDALLGTWTLLELARVIDGQVAGHPLGADAVGQLTYQPDGRMSALLMRRDRPWPPGAAFATATHQQRAEAAAGVIAYSGPYRVEPGRVVHRPEVSLLPEWLGTELVRSTAWSGVDLVLSSEPQTTRSGRSMQDRLTWRRVPGPG